jgi:hypothetical protein
VSATPDLRPAIGTGTTISPSRGMPSSARLTAADSLCHLTASCPASSPPWPPRTAPRNRGTRLHRPSSSALSHRAPVSDRRPSNTSPEWVMTARAGAPRLPMWGIFSASSAGSSPEDPDLARGESCRTIEARGVLSVWGLVVSFAQPRHPCDQVTMFAYSEAHSRACALPADPGSAIAHRSDRRGMCGPREVRAAGSSSTRREASNGQ